tara:strand:- start:71 stop:673 length:603 start_codon:yes stop_codon:yes gene_type:complete
VDLNYSTKNIFPVPIHIFDVNGFSEIQDELIDFVYKMREKDPDGHTISNRRGWQSSCFSIDNEDDVLQSFLTNCLAEFPPIKKSVKLFVSAWVNINPPDAFNIKHNHPTSDLSGVLWIKSQKDCGNIVFDSPRSFATHREIECYNEDFKENNNYFHSFHFNPIAGRLLVFPSHLDHHVDFNESQEDRISVSFNIRLSDEN